MGVWEFERMPPLGRYIPGEGFMPDYPVLMMFDEFVVDGEGFEVLRSDHAKSWSGDWPDVLEVLMAEGALELIDVEAAAKKRSHDRGWMLRRDLEEPSQWAGPMRYYNSLMTAADGALGDDPEEAEGLEWQYDPELGKRLKGPRGDVHDMSSTLTLLQEELPPDDPHPALKERVMSELRRQLREVNAALAVADELDVMPMVWAPYREYLHHKMENDQVGRLDAPREFFEIAFPRYAPTTPRQLAQLRADKRISSLREEITRAAAEGDLLDPEYPQRTLEEALRIERRIGRVRKIVSWIASAIGTVPIPGLNILASAAGEGIGKRIEKRDRGEYHWLYLVSDGTGRT